MEPSTWLECRALGCGIYSPMGKLLYTDACASSCTLSLMDPRFRDYYPSRRAGGLLMHYREKPVMTWSIIALLALLLFIEYALYLSLVPSRPSQEDRFENVHA